MINIEGPERKDESTELATVASGSIAKPAGPTCMSVGMLEQALLARFPRSNAESWDRTGLLVGDPTSEITGVCVALDPTRKAIEATAALGANVLLTHHPAFLSAPEAFTPSYDRTSAPGVNVYTAIANGVALVNFHTALDVSDEARRLYMDMLKLDYERMVEPSGANPERGYGYLCSVRPADAPLKVSQLAARCTSVFGRAPRVWGDFSSVVGKVVFANGSGNSVVGACLAEHVDCLVCGEVGYHVALDAWQAGLSVIELGHDASELPLAALLAKAAIEAGMSPDSVRVLDQGGNWSLPDSTRLYNCEVE